MNDSTDGELVALLRDGDRAAFTVLMRRHGPAVYRYAWALADEPGQVDDLLQDTFLVMWKRRRTISVIGDSLLPWLLTTCRFTAFNSNRRARFRRSLPLEAAEREPVPDRQAAARDELAWVVDELAKLSDLDRRLVTLCLVDGKSYADAGAELGITPTAARKRIQRTRARISEIRATNY